MANEPQDVGPRIWTRTVLGDWIRGGWRVRRAPGFRVEHGHLVVRYWLYQHGARWTPTGQFADAPNFLTARAAKYFADTQERGRA